MNAKFRFAIVVSSNQINFINEHLYTRNQLETMHIDNSSVSIIAVEIMIAQARVPFLLGHPVNRTL